MTMKALLERLYPLHRTLASDGTDEALRILGESLPAGVEYQIETFAPGTPVWTWRVPERYVVHEAYLEAEDGERIVDFRDNCLHLVSYSLPVDRWLTWEELASHLYYSEKRPDAIPWEFKYYERSWGFCLSKRRFDALRRDVRYHAVIRSDRNRRERPPHQIGGQSPAITAAPACRGKSMAHPPPMPIQAYCMENPRSAHRQ